MMQLYGPVQMSRLHEQDTNFPAKNKERQDIQR